MTIEHVKSWARVLARANIPAFIQGIHGIGKTSAIYQLYAEGVRERGVVPVGLDMFRDKMGLSTGIMSSIDGKKMAREYQDPDSYGFWSVSAANITSEEMIGMPDVEDRDAIYRQVFLDTLQAASRMAQDVTVTKSVHRQLFDYACESLGVSEVDKGRKVLRYLRMNALMPDPGHRGGGIWLIDELNLGFIEVEKAFMQILLEGRYLDYVLPNNIWVVTTMNPPCSSYPGARELALPTIDRGALLTVSPDKGEWLKWASRRGLSETSRMFVDKVGDKVVNLVSQEVNLEDYKNPATYRSVEWVDRAYAVMTPQEVDDVGLTVATSLLGPDAAIVYHREFKETSHKPLSLTDVINGYGWSEKMSREEEMDYTSWKITKSRSRMLSIVQKENVKTELIHFTLNEISIWVEDLSKELEERGSTKEHPKHTPRERGQILNMFLFLVDLPVDVCRGFWLKDLHDRVYTLVSWTSRYPIVRVFYDRIASEYNHALAAS